MVTTSYFSREPCPRALGVEQTATKQQFWFFFWVSLSLFIIAAANWIFNNFIGISILVTKSLGFSVSDTITYLLGSGVLFLGVFLVAAILNLAYGIIPGVRVILDGVLGLGKEAETAASSHTDSKKGKRLTYVELVNNDTRIGEEDIRSLFNSEMDHYGSFWLFLVGISIGILETLLILVVTVGTASGVQSLSVYLSYLTIASFGGLVAFSIGFWLILPRFGKDPTTVRQNRFKEYLDAKDAIIERDKAKAKKTGN